MSGWWSSHLTRQVPRDCLLVAGVHTFREISDGGLSVMASAGLEPASPAIVIVLDTETKTIELQPPCPCQKSRKKRGLIDLASWSMRLCLMTQRCAVPRPHASSAPTNITALKKPQNAQLSQPSWHSVSLPSSPGPCSLLILGQATAEPGSHAMLAEDPWCLKQ